MNKFKLRSILDNIINEGAYVTDRTGRTTYTSNEPTSQDLSRDPNVRSASSTAGKKLKEAELDEAAKYDVGDETKVPNYITKISSKKAKERIPTIIQAIKDAGKSLTGGDIAAAIGVKGQQPIYSLLLDLEAAGILTASNKISINRPSATKYSLPSTPAPTPTPSSEEETDEEDIDSEELTPEELDDLDDLADETEYSGDESDLFVGGGDISKIFSPYFSDEESEEPEETPVSTSQTPKYAVTAASKATDFFLDNERLLQRLINTFATTKTRIREEKEDGGVSSSDFNKAEKARKERSISGIDELVSQFVNKIQAEEPEVQKEIMRMLERKLESVNAVNLFKKISKQINYTSFSTPEAPETPEEIYLDDEEDDVLDEAILNRFRKIANIR